MIKFMLVIWVCSFLAKSECLAPVTYPKVYDSWMECSRAAHLTSIEIMDSFDPDFVNKYEIGMKYSCQQTMVY